MWDNKFRGDARNLKEPSRTFEPGSDRLKNAIEQAKRAINDANLPGDIKSKALRNLKNGNFTANTVGSGGLRNSFTIRYCDGAPC